MTAEAVTAIGALPAKRRGLGHWLSSYGAMLRWELTNTRLILPLLVLAQALSGAGLVLGFGLLMPSLPPHTAAFLVTGAAVVTLVMVGAAVGPQLVAQQKIEGSYDFMWSLPVPRSAATVAWVTLNMAIAIPGMLAALLAGAVRYHVSFDVSPLVVPAVLITLVSGTLLGYALAHAISKPEVTFLVSQVLIFVIFGFSPIAYPAANLPAWLATLHRYLPFVHMADVVRGSLVSGLATDLGHSYLVLGIWSVAMTAVTAAVLRRRK
jgi:ABC-2 type transport system permease protein